MWNAVTEAFTSIISLIGEFVTSLVGESGALAPLLSLFSVGIAISLVLLCIKAVRAICWGA